MKANVFNLNPPITIKNLLKESTKALKSSSNSPRLDVEILLSFFLNEDRSWLYTHLNEFLNTDLEPFKNLLKRRINGEPISYIIGYKEFWKDKFLVNRHTLIPRPETELIVENTLIWCNKNRIKNPVILDLGTGSGNIALSILRELKDAYAFCLDISFDALILAKTNAKRLGVEKRVNFFLSNWFSCIKEKPFFDVIVTNPPYVEEKDIDELDITVKKFEPKEALFAGEDGLLEIKNILSTLPFYIKSPMLFMSEIGFKQGKEVLKFLEKIKQQYKIDFSYNILKDLAGLDRVIKLEFN